jgi:hypothetical protein
VAYPLLLKLELIEQMAQVPREAEAEEGCCPEAFVVPHVLISDEEQVAQLFPGRLP